MSIAGSDFIACALVLAYAIRGRNEAVRENSSRLMIPWGLPKCENYCSPHLRQARSGCRLLVQSVAAGLLPSQAMRDEGTNALHGTGTAEQKQVIVGWVLEYPVF